ncbi:MAG: phosphoenolpyruvate--protein phosphotransferase [Bacteroidetes bacterium]|nr:phosphoenolpyruvate--protein phosphotransferase [Rhodothermia bacterium]MCS7155728.1 phosphoenolpyruvate--protein phosphotransferase [Bacteroidota bacterium]MCX7906171.1 phosphoenolpyruvate--protein phosphotransferase [Bacteroidota bacterium]MDW8138299.1 phosphoenolpyruvate--protein phosphotransferase [Bacteroidota bacterium]MDW8285983.1 phosphoenolpyruvate--protein phosphotransferase [Bacteroidota bacterium]
MGGTKPEVRLRGIPGSPGIAIGPAFLFERTRPHIPHRHLALEELDSEVARFREALERSERELRKIIDIARQKVDPEAAAIFEAQLLMLRDAHVYEHIEQRIRAERLNAEAIVHEEFEAFLERMRAPEDPYWDERAADVRDVQERLLRNLQKGRLLSDVEDSSIVVADELTPADLVLFSRRNIRGVALDFGGPTSHTVIIARSLRVPAVLGLHSITDQASPGDLLIVDGYTGRVILRPTQPTLRLYRRRQRLIEQRLRAQREELAQLPAQTRCGRRIWLRANLEFREELPFVAEQGADGIGLYRSEPLFLARGKFISEEEQYAYYREIVQAVRPHVATLRLFDVGGDKVLLSTYREPNPFLGWRGVRILLDRPEELLRPQLRAILRSSAHGSVRLLIPMVASLEELERFYAHYERALAELRAEGHAIAERVPVGVMIEVPSAAVLIDQIAERVNFVSIGTNDLIQYLLAVDRGNDLVANLYQEFHPAVLRTLKHIIDGAHQKGVPVALCGEMASNPLATVLLVGLGLDELSVNPVMLPEIKRTIRAIDYEEARSLAAELLQLPHTAQIEARLRAWREASCPEPDPFVFEDY